jgi:hypothetical protein
VRIELEAPQFAALRAMKTHHTVGLGWGRGGGKSYFDRLAGWYLPIAEWDGRRRPGATDPGVRIAHLMPTLAQAKKVHAQKMRAELAPEGPWGFLGARIDRTNWRVTFPGGSWVQWVSAEVADNARGIRCDIATVDEADDIDPAVYDAVLLPWFSEPWSAGLSILSGTPRRGRYGLLYRSFARARGRELDDEGQTFDDHFFSHATCYEFPRFISAANIARAKRESAPAYFQREYLCDFDAAEGLVYSLFDEDFHVREPDPRVRWREYIVGVDWGYAEPTAILVFGIAGHGQDVTIHQLDEIYETDLADSQIADIAKRLEVQYPGARWYADPSRPQSIADVKKFARVRIEPAENPIEDGIATVTDALLIRERSKESEDVYAKLYVSPRCRSTIREFGEYRRKRDRKNPDRVLEAPEDKNNHAMDALRYAIFSHFGGPDRRIAAGYGHR